MRLSSSRSLTASSLSFPLAPCLRWRSHRTNAAVAPRERCSARWLRACAGVAVRSSRRASPIATAAHPSAALGRAVAAPGKPTGAASPPRRSPQRCRLAPRGGVAPPLPRRRANRCPASTRSARSSPRLTRMETGSSRAPSSRRRSRATPRRWGRGLPRPHHRPPNRRRTGRGRSLGGWRRCSPPVTGVGVGRTAPPIVATATARAARARPPERARPPPPPRGSSRRGSPPLPAAPRPLPPPLQCRTSTSPPRSGGWTR